MTVGTDNVGQIYQTKPGGTEFYLNMDFTQVAPIQVDQRLNSA